MDCLIIAGIIIIFGFIGAFIILPIFEKKYGFKIQNDDFC